MSNFNALNQRIKQDMANELRQDTESGKLYTSPLLTKEGQGWYPSIFLDAVLNGDAKSMADYLIDNNLIVPSEPIGPDDGEIEVLREKVEAFTKQEFNNLNARAVCQCAIDDHKEYVEVYRAENVPDAPLAVQRLVDAPVRASDMLANLRNNRTLEGALGLAEGSNSGLGLRFLQDTAA